MSLQIYNSAARCKEVFVPLDPENVRFYVCGPTVYNRIHIGNARPVVVFDLLFRLLQHLYPQVTYVQNITDVDDKIIAAAQEKGVSVSDLTQHFIHAFHEDTHALNVCGPTIEPRATDHISHMIKLIETLLEKGHAYIADGQVIFHVNSFTSYGFLSKRTVEELHAGARVEVGAYKKNPEDFVLWKPSKGGEIGWQSPWGYGRPGWHIECSAMAREYLGPTFDIHGGGRDLIFPHHENERAQSHCSSDGLECARYWMHNGHVVVEGKKMAKSLGNFILLKDAIHQYGGEVVRYALLMAHYRQPLDWRQDTAEQARKSLDKLYTALKDFSYERLSNPTYAAKNKDTSFLYAPVQDALEDDLNTPLAFSHLHELVGKIHKAAQQGATEEKQKWQRSLLFTAQFMGFLTHTPQQWFSHRAQLSPEEIEKIIAEREDARKHKDFKRADQLRQALFEEGVELEDGPQGTTWRTR